MSRRERRTRDNRRGCGVSERVRGHMSFSSFPEQASSRCPAVVQARPGCVQACSGQKEEPGRTNVHLTLIAFFIAVFVRTGDVDLLKARYAGIYPALSRYPVKQVSSYWWCNSQVRQKFHRWSSHDARKQRRDGTTYKLPDLTQRVTED